MSVVIAGDRFIRRGRFGTRADELIHARHDAIVKFRSGWIGNLEDCAFPELIVAIWDAANQINPAACCAESFVFDDKSGVAMEIVCSTEVLEDCNLSTPSEPIEVNIDGYCYIVSFSER